MTWTSNLVLLLISNSISVCIAWLLWRLMVIPLKALRLYTVCYRLFALLPVFWLVPFHYLYCSFHYFKMHTVWMGLPWHGDAFEDVLRYLGILWALGVFVATANVIFGFYQLKRLPLSSNYSATSQAGEMAWQMDQRSWLLDAGGNVQLYPGLNFDSPVRAYQTHIPVPMTPLGINHKILLPYYPYTRQELEMVVAHELSHIRRHDLALRGLLIAIKVLFWFHPLAWRIFRDFEYWSEIACDVDVCSGKHTYIQPKKYFYLLIQNAENAGHPNRRRFCDRNYFMSGLGNGAKMLRDRIKKAQRCRLPKLLPLITLLACLIFLFGGSTICLAAVTGIEQGFSGAISERHLQYSAHFPVDTASQEKDFNLESKEPKYVANILVERFTPTAGQLEESDTFYIYFEHHLHDSYLLFFDGTAKAHSAGFISTRYFHKGTQVTLYINDATNPEALLLGLQKPDGTYIYFSCENVSYTTIDIPVSGNYKLFVENTGDSPQTVCGRLIF